MLSSNTASGGTARCTGRVALRSSVEATKYSPVNAATVSRNDATASPICRSQGEQRRKRPETGLLCAGASRPVGVTVTGRPREASKCSGSTETAYQKPTPADATSTTAIGITDHARLVWTGEPAGTVDSRKVFELPRYQLGENGLSFTRTLAKRKMPDPAGEVAITRGCSGPNGQV